MKFITLSNHQLCPATAPLVACDENAFLTGVPALDELVPGGFARGVMHEILIPKGESKLKFFTLLLARSAMAKKQPRRDTKEHENPFLLRVPSCSFAVDPSARIAWCDPHHQLWPAGLQAQGISIDRLLILRPRKPADELWAMAECLRCKAIGVTVGSLDRLTQVEARRLQLAAEEGGGVGLLLRPMTAHSSTYAAATRWLVQPAVGDAVVQRWKIQLIHGQGRQVGRSVLLEFNREANSVCASEIVADRSHSAAPRIVSA
jgi:hypothetical protein